MKSRALTLIFISAFLYACKGDLIDSMIEVSDISVTVDSYAATVAWKTSIETRHLVEYGTASADYQNSTLLSSSPKKTHAVEITGLNSDSTYFYRIRNFNEKSGNAVSDERSFTTTPVSGPSIAQKLRGIWVVGGSSNLAGTIVYAQIDLYDPVTDTWYSDVTAGATGTYIPTSFNMVASVNGKLYVIGGANATPTVTSTVYEYNITTNAWTTKADIQLTGIPTPLMASAVYTHLGSIYLIGGTTAVTTAGVSLSYHMKFNPAGGTSGSWTDLLAYLTAARSSMGASNIGGMVYHYGGRIIGGGSSIANDCYMISMNNYSAAAENTLTATTAAGAAYASYSGTNGTYVFAIGGSQSFTAAANYFGLTASLFVPQLNSFQIYTPPQTGAAVWINGKNHPSYGAATSTGIVFAAAAVSPYNGSTLTDPTVYVFGGIKGLSTPSIAATNEVWSVTANSTPAGYPGVVWYPKATMPCARFGHGVTLINQ